jgi:pyruvate dehydrogenase complex dehydrogenase (E1) component
MGSASHKAAAGARGKHVAQDETEISKAAKLLIDQHGKDADIVAAQRADALLRDGNTAEGNRWLEIFRRIAMPRLRRAP